MRTITFFLLLLLLASCANGGYFVQTTKKFTEAKIRTFAPNAVFGDSTDIVASLPKKQIDKVLGRRMQKLFAANGAIGLSWQRVGTGKDSVKIHIYYHNRKQK